MLARSWSGIAGEYFLQALIAAEHAIGARPGQALELCDNDREAEHLRRSAGHAGPRRPLTRSIGAALPWCSERDRGLR
jgi:hypothetical protein